MEVYDPRDGKVKQSNNTALILGQIIKTAEPSMSQDDWSVIAELADYCDGEHEDEEQN